MKNLLHTLAAVGLVATPFVGARADLVLVSPSIVTVGGTGLGAVNTVLTIQSQGSGSNETGCVAYSGSGDQLGGTQSGGVCSGSSGDVKTGSSQTQTRTLSEAGITQGSNFAVFFNAAEPGGNSITLNQLSASFYGSTGNLLHTAVFMDVPHFFPSTATGTGNTGYLFALTAAEQSTLQTFITNLGAANIHVGISAAASDATGGQETFFILNNATTQISATPEPATLALVATGLFGLIGVAKRRRNS
jgi:hypothetical protein